MARRVLWILIAAAAVAAVAPTPGADAALRGRVTGIEAFGAPTARPSAQLGAAGTFRVRPARRPRARGVDDDHFAPVPVPGQSVTRRVGRSAIVVVDARRSAARRSAARRRAG